MFLLAYTDLRRAGRTTLGACTARSLRRVGADVAVVLHCVPSAARRLRREARYDHVVTYTLTGAEGLVDVAVLSDCPLVLRAAHSDVSMLCDLTVDGKRAAVGAFGETEPGLYRVLVHLDQQRPVVVVGDTGEDLDDPLVIDGIVHTGFVDTHPARPTSDHGRPVRTTGILARGLHSYGDGTYLDPDGCEVHWARLGH